MIIQELREQLPFLNSCIYLNYGLSSPLFLDAAKKMSALTEQSKEPFQFHIEEWMNIFSWARKTVAHLINAAPNEIAFTMSTSHGLSIIANAIKWNRGDVIVYPADEFPSNRFVWDNLKEKGVLVKPLLPSSEISFEEQLERLELKNIRMVACSAISYLNGRKFNIEKISQFCRKHQILLSVDAIQATGAIPIDVKIWDCDFLATAGRKWLFGPHGVGFIYIKKERIPELFVSQVGWGSAKQPLNYQDPQLFFDDGARRFEPGNMNLITIAGLAASVEKLCQIGFSQIYQRIETLTDYLQLELNQDVVTPKNKGGILALKPPNVTEMDQKLKAHNFILSQREDLLRICLHASVTDSELEAFLNFYKKHR